MKRLCIISAICAVVFALVLGGCAQPAPAPAPAPTPTPVPEAKVLKIGGSFGLTGPGSQDQMGWRNAAQLCCDWINEKGGVTVKGEKYQIKFIVEDNKFTPTGALDSATKLVYDEGVKFIIGTGTPVVADGACSVTEKNKVIYVADRTGAVSPDKPYFFTSCYGFAAPLPFLYQVMLEKYPSVKSVGYIVEDETGARMVGDISRQIAQGFGLTALEPQIHPWESTEYYPEWTKILINSPDAVDVGIKMAPNVANSVKQGRELGFKGPTFATYGEPYLLIQMIGNKQYATDFFLPNIDVYDSKNVSPVVAEILKRWEKSSKDRMDSNGPSNWDAIWCIVQAIEKAQSIDPTDVKNAWENMQTIETSFGTGKMGGAKTFGINHMVFKPCPITRLQNGEIEFIKWVDDTWMP